MGNENAGQGDYARLRGLFGRYDSRGMGAISLDDFLAYRRLQGSRGARKDTAEFLWLDRDQDGLVSPEDLDGGGRLIPPVSRKSRGALSGLPFIGNFNEKFSGETSRAKEYLDAAGEGLAGSCNKQKVAGYALYSYTVPCIYLHEGQEGTSILHLSDLHFGRRLFWPFGKPEDGKKIDFLEALKGAISPPDFVIITGDFVVRGFCEMGEKALCALAGLPGAHKLFVLGNHDYLHGGERHIRPALEECGYTDITNRTLRFEVGGKPMLFSGADDHINGKPQPPEESEWATVMPHVLMTHNLDAVNRGFFPAIDLVVAGHLHGGEVNFGPINGRSLRKMLGVYDGVNDSEKAALLLSRRASFVANPGLGTHLPFRMFAPGAGATRLVLAKR